MVTFSLIVRRAPSSALAKESGQCTASTCTVPRVSLFVRRAVLAPEARKRTRLRRVVGTTRYARRLAPEHAQVAERLAARGLRARNYTLVRVDLFERRVQHAALVLVPQRLDPSRR
mgnify:CR=1 FL=1